MLCIIENNYHARLKKDFNVNLENEKKKIKKPYRTGGFFSNLIAIMNASGSA